MGCQMISVALSNWTFWKITLLETWSYVDGKTALRSDENEIRRPNLILHRSVLRILIDLRSLHMTCSGQRAGRSSRVGAFRRVSQLGKFPRIQGYAGKTARFVTCSLHKSHLQSPRVWNQA